MKKTHKKGKHMLTFFYSKIKHASHTRAENPIYAKNPIIKNIITPIIVPQIKANIDLKIYPKKEFAFTNESFSSYVIYPPKNFLVNFIN